MLLARGFHSVKRMSASRVIYLACAAACLPVAVRAQNAGALQQNLQREIDKNRSAPVPEVSPKKQEPDIKPQQATRDTIFIKAIRVTGLTLISAEAAQAAVSKFLNKELTFEQIEEAGRAITELYTQIGRTATAVVPEQDVEDATIEIKIIEGKVGEIIIDNETSGVRSRLKSNITKGFIAQGNAQGQPLSLDSLSRSALLLNELPGISASTELVKGQIDGTSDIRVTLNDSSVFTGRLDVSNYGSASTGKAQATGDFNVNNPLGIGDLATFDLIDSKGSTYSTLKYWLPIGYDGWRIGLGGSDLNYSSLPSFSTTLSNGGATVYGLYSTYALKRAEGSTQTLNFCLEQKKYANYTNSIESSHYRILNAISGVSGNRELGKDNISYALTATFGHLNIDNAQQLTTDQSATGAQTQGQFAKLNMNESYTKKLPIENTVLLLSFNGQLASKNLNSSEQMYLGGAYAVRAYPVSQGGGSQGYVGTVEITHTYPNQLQLGAFVDAGTIQQYKSNWSTILQGNTNAADTYSLYATGLTGKYSWAGWQLQAVFAYRVGQNPLYNSSGLQLNSDNQYRTIQSWIKGSYLFN